MNLLRFLVKLLGEILKGISYRWLLFLLDYFRRLLRALREMCERLKASHFDETQANTGCAQVDHPSFHRPDPLIYSQQYLLSLGLAVTWDNPDIALLRNGVVVSEGDLLPNTEYEIRATIWNNAYDAPVVGLQVDFSFLSFGAGTTNHPIGTKFINLGVKGGPSCPAFASILWITPPAGHYCILVTLTCADDLNPNNNVGQNNVNVVAAHSPAVFSFQLRNGTRRAQTYRFEMDVYTLPSQPVCPPRLDRTQSPQQRWKSILATHDRRRFPIPPGWAIALSPQHPLLNPAEETTVNVTVTPPADFSGEQVLNVHAFPEVGPSPGGVTVQIVKT